MTDGFPLCRTHIIIQGTRLCTVGLLPTFSGPRRMCVRDTPADQSHLPRALAVGHPQCSSALVPLTDSNVAHLATVLTFDALILCLQIYPKET